MAGRGRRGSSRSLWRPCPAVVPTDDEWIYARVLAGIYVCVLFFVILLLRRFVSFVMQQSHLSGRRGRDGKTVPPRAWT